MIKPSTARCGFVLAALFSGPASAATVWVDWTASTLGAPGSALGSASGVVVRYAGELDNAVINGTSAIWAPNSSFVGGTSTTSLSTVSDELQLNGSSTASNTITFGTPVVNPLIAIWSLGQPGAPASFTFDHVPTLQAGGPNSFFGGASLTVAGNTVSGVEGNGVVQFTGTFSSISWTDTFENFYAFTVGINGVNAGVPEPATLTLLALGLAGVGLGRRKQP